MQTSAQELAAPAADVTRQDQGEDRHAASDPACMEPIFARLERFDDLRSVKPNVSSGESRSGEALLWYGASASALATGYVASAYAASLWGRDRTWVADRHVRFHPGASSTAQKSSANEGRRGRVVGGILGNLERVWSNLLRLGPRRLAALGLAGITVFAATGLSGYYLSRPAQEVLYAGLDRQDVSRIGAALNEAGIGFDVSADGATVFVRYGQSGPARMLLAEKGLPNGATGGYELFDKLGSLGLTSFMQEVTRVRAIEGELARTIQLIRGVKAARVHIVMPDEGSFRRARQPPSASVILRTDSPSDNGVAAAIRHLVSAAVPGMKTDQVTVIGSDGTLLATQDDQADAAPGRTRSLEKSLSHEIQDNIRKTLSSYLSLKNFQVSVAARLNTDKRQVNETIYNPESRVERSIRVIKENQSAQNATQAAATSVERNLPQDSSRNANGKQSNEENQKREEITNFEVSSKTITTVSAGYAIETLSVAVW